MFKVFRIKEEHSAFLSDGGGIGSRGLASVRLHHASLFLLSLTVSLSSSLPLFLSFFFFFCSPPLHVYSISLSFSTCVFCWFALSVCHSLYHSALRYFPLALMVHLSSFYLLSSVRLLYPSLSLSIQFYHLSTSLSSSFLPLHLCLYLFPVSLISHGGP